MTVLAPCFLTVHRRPCGPRPVSARVRTGWVAWLAIAALFAAGPQPIRAEESPRRVLCGIDVLVRDDFQPLQAQRVGLITNHTGVDRQGRSTALLMHEADAVQLETLFSPEHGFAGALDQSKIDDVTDPTTGLHVYSLYGKTRRPTAEMLEGLDTLVFDIQDIGTRFYTYIATMGEAMHAAEQHGLRFVVLDRPNPINGVDLAGPMLDSEDESFVGYHVLPVRHGMTTGELARMFQRERYPDLKLQVIACEGWQRDEYYDDTDLYWVNPSPNMRTLNQAILYPGIGLLEFTNLSVGRGTDTPFEHIGAPWIDGRRLATALNRLDLGGVAFVPKHFTPTSSKFAGERCEGIHILIRDRAKVHPVKIGLAIATLLRAHHPDAWEMKNFNRLLSSQAIRDAVAEGASLDEVLPLRSEGLEAFEQRREQYLLYR
ncbi:exo-beta-N-acetylmuramidase NamZ family protein [Roseimaritima sediminicola]|uniref:exo-beta-N-acetylmuramidase NamZ family protein n=1 Tax=Roseimaritima sediminicola TaxID=2662066 RepID=UPI00129832BB|nr:DUF1343 domain-containing protein [Roseimaritima sediminicola]